MPKRTKIAERLIAIVESFPGRRVVVLGDLVADEFIYGDIARISREAPVLILEHQRTVAVPGGGGNSVANLQALGAQALPLGVVGRDGPGSRLLAEFKRIGVRTRGIATLAGYETPSKSRILAGGIHTRRQQIVRLDRGAGRGELPRAIRTRLRRGLETALKRADGMLVADYGYGAASPVELGPRLAEIARGGFPVAVDSRSRVARFRRVTACTPNQEELEEAVGAAGLDEGGIDRAARSLLRQTGNRALLVTRGAKGMGVYRAGRPVVRIAAYGSDEIADVTGAGDTVTAAFTLALTCGADTVDAARIANFAAGIVVTKVGTATVSPRELIRAIEEDCA